MSKVFIILLLFPFLIGAGCVPSASKGDGGVFKSEDRGDTWAQKVFVKTEKNRPVTIAGTSAVEFEFDPKDANTIYLGTSANGGWVTKNSGDNWEPFGPRAGALQHITINPKNTNEIYIGKDNLVYKSVDKGQNWTLIYTEPRDVRLTGLEVDIYDPKRVYMSLANGQLLLSLNAGFSWAVMKDFTDRIEKFLIDPRDTRRIYVFTRQKGIFKTVDLGKEWMQIKESLGKFSYALEYRGAAWDFSKKDSLLYASKYGILRTDDGGVTWSPFSLLTQPGSIDILAVAADPKMGSRIYYTTLTKFYKTEDNGQSWIVKTLPSSLSPSIIKIHPQDTKILYVGAQKVEQKKKSFFVP
ncbi:MAG: hypothetical protein HY602_01850 [Parcubacteria group bacterium]|nr:hypothetical protein [Parcubacteria group bacterium]